MNWNQVYKTWLNPTHGLELEPNINTGYRGNENGILFLAELILLKQHFDGLDSADREIVDQTIDHLRSYFMNDVDRYCGLFDRGQNDSLGHLHSTRTISHDNLTAIVSLSSDLGLGWNNSIATHGLKNWMRYDNVTPNSPRWSRIQHPRDWFYWLYLGNHKSLAMIFFPIFLISNILSCLTDDSETSGKLLMFVRCFRKKQWPLKLTWWICNKILIRRYEMDNWMIPVTNIYFPQSEDNPIRVISKMIKSL